MPARLRLEWKLSTFVTRIGEISAGHGGASLTFTFQLVLEAQQRGEPVAWVHREQSVFFPPDVAMTGVDLDALAVVRVADIGQAARAADHLLRSGGFGLVVLDLGDETRMPMAIQSRLAGLVRRHRAALLCLTERKRRRTSLGPLVALRVETHRRKKTGHRYHCEVQVLKDKQRGPGRSHQEVCRGPDGLR